MTETPQPEGSAFIIGTSVHGDDGDLGVLRRVVVDPIARAITHLVVEPPHRTGAGHLVPVTLVTAASPEAITLSCDAATFANLEEAENIRFLPGASGGWGYAPSQMLMMPYYPLSGAMGMAGPGPQAFITDRVPAGDVEVRRNDPVLAVDGAIGRVQGLIVDPSDLHVTHILLDEGHLWGKKRVAIGIGAVTSVDDAGVHVSLDKQQIADLPEIAVGEH